MMLNSSLSGCFIINYIILSCSSWPTIWRVIIIWNTLSTRLGEGLREMNILGHDLLGWLYCLLQLFLLYLFLILKADRLRIVQLALFDNHLIMTWAAKVYICVSEIVWWLRRLIIDIIKAILISIVYTLHLITQRCRPIGQSVFEYRSSSCFRLNW